MENNQFPQMKKEFDSRKSMDKILKIQHNIHCSYEKVSLDRDRTMLSQKDRPYESFDDWFSYRKKKCKLKQINNWLQLF